MDTLSNFHGDFIATGSSAVDISQNILVGDLMVALVFYTVVR